MMYGYEVHVASYVAKEQLGAPLAARLEALNNGEYGSFPKDAKKITLHPIKGESVTQTYIRTEGIDLEGFSRIQKSGARVALKMHKKYMDVYSSFHRPVYMQVTEEFSSVIKTVQPNVIVVDHGCA
jgi:hypothetical protein